MAEPGTNVADEIESYLAPYMSGKEALEEARIGSLSGESPAPNTTAAFPKERFQRENPRSALETRYKLLLRRDTKLAPLGAVKNCIFNYEASARARQVRLRSYKDYLRLGHAESEVRLKWFEVERRILKDLFIKSSGEES